MRFTVKLLVVIVLMLSLIITGPASADKGPIGISCLQQVEKLPYIYTGVRAFGASSHDRTGGIGDAGKFLGTVGSENIMMDVAGPGCVYRIWVTGVNATNRIRVYLDGSATPQINRTITEMFGGTSSPFLSPLVGDNTVSSGGFYCYLPIPFRTGCRMTIDNANSYYNIGYQTYSDANGVTTYTGAESVSAVVNQWNNCGSDPKSTPDARTRTGTVSIPSGNTVSLINETGPGTINRIKITIPRLNTYDDISKLIMWSTRIRIYWDNEPTPRVDSPIGPFFGAFNSGATVRSLFVGTITPSQFYCYFPMPFGTRTKVEIYNGTPYGISIEGLSYDIGIGDMPNAATMLASQQIGRFAARWFEQDVYNGGADFLMSNLSGTGVAVGVSLHMVGPYGTDRGYLEGDERIHVDGSLTPCIYGTGTEDFFNGGWYFDRGIFNRPLHGHPTYITSPTDTTVCYRLFLGDRMQYKSAFYSGIEHGGYNEKNGKYSCVAYGYEAGASTSTQTDSIDIGNTTSESAHSYTISNQKWSGTSTFYYEGDADHSTSSDNGRSHSGYSQFTAAVDPLNGGVILRRKMDYSTADQKANVYVDGSLVGVWYEAGNNNAKSWRDSEFQIPGSFTSGKNSIIVKLSYVSGAWWTEYKYQIFSLRDTSIQPGTINGHVYASGGGALQGVRLSASPGGSWNDTNSTGAYTITPLSSGSYTVTASKFGYVPQSKPVVVPANGTVSVDFTLIPIPTSGSPSQAKLASPGTWIRIDNIIVTGVFSGLVRFYTERPDRSGGIGVVGTGAVLGDKVNLTGQVTVVDGEIVINNPTLQVTAQGQTVPRAVGMNQISIGGGQEGYQGAVVNKALSNSYASGRNSIGLLVRTAGRVSYADPSGGVFWLDDGSAISDGSGHTGVKVDAAGLSVPSSGRQVTVTGISSTYTINGKIARLIRPRTSVDISFQQGPNLIANPGFETGNHTSWGSIGTVGTVQCAPWFADIVAHSGTCYSGVAVNGGTALGWLYQRVPVTSGRTYQATAWSTVFWGDNNSLAAQNRIGIDPTGGTGTPSASTIWSPWDQQASGYTWQWRNISTSATASGSYITIYLEIYQQTPAGWHINCFDDVECREW